MSSELTTHDVRMAGGRMGTILGLKGSAVGVRLLLESVGPPQGALRLHQHRYCQAVMRARHGESVLLDAGGIACPAAAAAFGFRPLPDGLRSGKGLAGFGIVADPSVGARMFAGMPRLEKGRLQGLHCFPLDRAQHLPDIVVVEDAVERLMWVLLASLHASGGERVQSSTAVLQAVCADATLIPYLEDRMNFSYGCYGCRDATDISEGEAVLGFPVSMLPGILEHLEVLARKAIPVSRAKKVFTALSAGPQESADARR